MFEYGALFGSSFTEQMSEKFAYFMNWAGNINPLWYVAGVVAFFLLVRMMTGKKVR